jgi:hypothetical protein
MKVHCILIASAVIMMGCSTTQTKPLPKRCTSVESFHFTRKAEKQLSRFISEQNAVGWLGDIRRHDVCLQELVATNHLGLIGIDSPVSSHWQRQYFINGSTGVSTIKLIGNNSQVMANVQAALDEHLQDFSPEEVSRIVRYFESR